MSAVIISAMLLAILGSPAYAAQASLRERTEMSISIADYIVDAGKSNPFKAHSVELGTATIEGHWALADWRSADGKVQGRVSFFFLCDHWNVGKVITRRDLRAHDFVGGGMSGIPAEASGKLVAELSRLESQHVAFLKPARAGPSC